MRARGGGGRTSSSSLPAWSRPRRRTEIGSAIPHRWRSGFQRRTRCWLGSRGRRKRGSRSTAASPGKSAWPGCPGLRHGGATATRTPSVSPGAAVNLRIFQGRGRPDQPLAPRHRRLGAHRQPVHARSRDQEQPARLLDGGGARPGQAALRASSLSRVPCAGASPWPPALGAGDATRAGQRWSGDDLARHRDDAIRVNGADPPSPRHRASSTFRPGAHRRCMLCAYVVVWGSRTTPKSPLTLAGRPAIPPSSPPAPDFAIRL